MQSDSSKTERSAKHTARNIINAIYGLLSAISDFAVQEKHQQHQYKEKKTATSIGLLHGREIEAKTQTAEEKK